MKQSKHPLTMAVCVALSILALSACAKKQAASGSNSTMASTAAPAATKAAKRRTGGTGVYASAAAGKTLYIANCSSCHQANGQGQAGVFPPLAHNAVVTGNPAAPIHIIKNGLNKRITVNGSSYQAQMPVWKGTLSNTQIAEVLSYVRSAWGNHAPPVSAKQVASTP